MPVIEEMADLDTRDVRENVHNYYMTHNLQQLRLFRYVVNRLFWDNPKIMPYSFPVPGR